MDKKYEFVSVPVPEKEVPKYEKKYEVHYKGEFLGHVSLTFERDWHFDGIEKTGEPPCGSRTFAAARLYKFIHGG